MLIELPIGLENAQLASLRRFLKVLVRSYGIKCLSVLPPNETRTFGSQAGSASNIGLAATVDDQAAAIRSDDEDTTEAKPAGLAKPPTTKRKRLPIPSMSKPL